MTRNLTRRTVRLASVAAILLTGACSRHGSEQASLREPDTESRLRVAATAAAAGQTDIALSMYTAAAAAAPNDPEAQARLVSMLMRAGKPGPAEQALSRALANHPTNQVLLRWLGNLRLETGSAEAALQIFDGLIARKPDDVRSLNGRGIALDLLGQHEAAQQTYRTAQAAAPSDLQTANNLAVSYLLSHHPAQALDALLPFAQQPDLPPRAKNNLAIAQAAVGSSPAADLGTPAPMNADDIRTMAASLSSPIGSSLPSPSAATAKPSG